MNLLILLGCLILATAGCSSTTAGRDPAPDPIVPVPENFYDPYYPSADVIIESGDVLTVRFYYHPELDSKQTVRQDGKISLTLLQGLDVAGQTPEELQQRLVTLYSNEFVEPVITVEIDKESEAVVFVTGQVASGGIKSLKSNRTIGQVLAQSSPMESDADLSTVVLVRKHGPKEYKVYLVDARFEDGLDRDIYLAPGDIIVVPQNTITIIGVFVQKFIRNIIPPQMSIYYGITSDLTSDFALE